jgi:hypothetical protein
MREAIGGTWLVQIVVVFVLLFTGYMCLTINHSKAFNVKNNIINAIERAGGCDVSNPDDDETIQNIVEYLSKVSYRSTGTCPDDATYSGFDYTGQPDNSNPAFCIAKVDTTTSVSGNNDDLPDMSYYRVVVFYQLDLPIFSSVFNFKVTGDTKLLNTSFSGITYKRKITDNTTCIKYKNGKKVGEVPCSTVSGEIIGG